MLRVELTTQLMRARTLVTLGLLAAIPFGAGLSLASSAGHRNGTQGGFFGASPYSALNHTVASLAFLMPLLLPVAVALLATAIASADRDWGLLRYLYVAPTTLGRLLTAKLGAVALATSAAVATVLATGLVTGVVLFGWHPFHRIGSQNLSASVATGRALEATGYTLVCMLAMASIAFLLGLVLPRGAEALAASVAFVLALTMFDDQRDLHAIVTALPVHYWQRWEELFEQAGTADLGTGIAAQLATIAVCTGASLVVLRRRDPAA